MDLKAKRIRRVCDVPGCRNTVSYSLSRFRTFGNCVILCEECLNDALKLVNEIKEAVDIEPLHLCPICDEIFTTDSALTEHMDIHKTGPTIPTISCNVCGETFLSQSDLNNHMSVHVSFDTADTGEAVAEVYSVESEDTVDTTDNADIADTSDTTDTSDATDTADTAVVYTCDVCGKEFDSEANLKRHIAMAHKDGE